MTVKRVDERKKELLKSLVEGAIMGLALFVMFGSMLYRKEITSILNVVLDPLASLAGNFLITVLILAVLTGIYTSVIQKYTTDWELMAKSKEFQKQLKELQKEYIAAKRENNRHRLKQIEKRRAEVMSEQARFSGELMRQQFKPMAYIIIVTIPIFFWMWEYAPSEVVLFPLIGAKNLSHTFIFRIPYWLLWYMICSFLLTVVIRKLLGIRSTM